MTVDNNNEVEPNQESTVGDLIVEGQYGEALESLKSRFAGRSPGPHMRMQLADLLARAGRSEEAVPILLGLADEFATQGSTAKAVAALKRVDSLRPGLPEVSSKLALLVRPRPEGTSFSTLAGKPAERSLGEIVEGVSNRPSPPPPPPTDTPLPDAEPREAGEDFDSLEALLFPPSAPDSPPSERGTSGSDAETSAPGQGAETKTRRVLRRFISSLSGSRKTDADARSEVQDEQAVSATDAPTETGFDGSMPPEPPPEAAAETATLVGSPRAAVAALPRDTDAHEPSEDPAVLTGAAPASEPAAQVPPPRSVAGPVVLPESEPTAAAEPAKVTEALSESAPDDAGTRAEPLPGQGVPATAAEQPTEPTEQEDTASDTRSRSPGRGRTLLGWAHRLFGGVRILSQDASQETQAPHTGDTSPVGSEGASPVEPSDGEAAPPSVAPGHSEGVSREVAELPGKEEEFEDETTAADVSPAPSSHESPPEAPAEQTPTGHAATVFEGQLLDFVEDLLHRPPDASGGIDSDDTREHLGVDTEWALLASPLFAGLTDDERVTVLEALRLHTFEAGDVILTEGQGGDSLFTLVSGTVKVLVKNPDGHNIVVSTLLEGDFFGEIASISGRPRSATLVAATTCELFEFDKPTIDFVARRHPGTKQILETFYVQRVESRDAAAVRTMARADELTREAAAGVLRAHFGDRTWDPRMQLQLAKVLIKAGKRDEALPILVHLADELMRANLPARAIAVLKKIEHVHSEHVRELNLAPLGGGAKGPQAAEPEGLPEPDAPQSSVLRAGAPPRFQDWFVDFVRDALQRHWLDAPPGRHSAGSGEDPSSTASLGGYVAGLKASPLFDALTEEELLAVIKGLRLVTFEPGEIVLTEGEPGDSIFVLASGSVKVSVCNKEGVNVGLCMLHGGAFVGEIAALTGLFRIATVTTASHCELLELDRATLDSISAVHPRVREVLQEHYAERSGSPEAAAIRSSPR